MAAPSSELHAARLVRGARAWHGWTQQRLADELRARGHNQVSRPTVARWEAGTLAVPILVVLALGDLLTADPAAAVEALRGGDLAPTDARLATLHDALAVCSALVDAEQARRLALRSAA